LLHRATPRGLYPAAPHAGLPVDDLSDDDVQRLNRLLPWRCFTVDARGRAIGGVAWRGKRDQPQPIPDPRIERFDARFGLAGKHVLEVGCFEGAHTIALCRLAAQVTAVDARVENVAKTLVRCALYDAYPRVFTLDLESSPDEEVLRADLCHHVGVLYHLSDPVTHLRRLGRWVSEGLMLDTHYATPEGATDVYKVDGRSYRHRRYGEHGRRDAFSGMRSYARWLLLDDIVSLLSDAGFHRVEVAEQRDERNGPRVLLFAERPGSTEQSPTPLPN
jgi:tRNA (mo5U34)-methyltransferase